MIRILTLLLFSTVLAPICEATERPNIIVILADDMGFSDIGCYGSEIPTPHLDSLAANGVKFKQFYNNARCCPTRASLLTGLYSHQAGIGHMAGRDQKLPGYLGHLNDQCVTIAQWLQPAGYFTAMCGKWHVGAEAGSNPWERGFQRCINATAGGFYLPDSDKTKLFEDGKPIASRGGSLPQDWYSSDLWSLLGLRFVSESKAAGKPFFLYLPFNAPHFPLQARAEDIAKFRGSYKRGWDALRDERHARQIELGLIDASWKRSPRPGEIKLWSEHTPEEQDRFDHLMAVYAATVHCMDRAIGDLIARLKKEGAFENTLILFMSDNGGNAESGPAGRTNGDPTLADSNWFCGESWAFLQNTPFRRYKHYTHEGGISTPLIAHWPQGITKRGWINEPAHLIDIAATIQDLTGAAYPKEHAGKAITPLEGTSLKPLLVSTASSLPISRSLFWEHEGNAAVREGDLKLVRKGSNGPWELYDLKTDRTEMNDLASSQPGKVKELADAWQKWAERAHVLPQPSLSHDEGATPKKGKGKGKAKAKAAAAPQTTAAPADTTALIQPRRAAGADPLRLLPPDADLQGDAAPRIAMRPFTVRVEVAKAGTQGVLAAQGGQANGWALFLHEGKLIFVMNRDNERAELATDDAAWKSARELKATVGPQAWVKLWADGKELARKPLGGLLPSQPLDGLQVGRDLAAPVADYKVPFAFDGIIASAALEVGDEQPAPPFVGSVPSGGVVPRMDAPEQTRHPFPGRDKFGGDLRVTRKATGFFRTEQIGGRWFFITPEGHPFIAIGPNHTGPTLRHQGKESGLLARFGHDPGLAGREMLKTIHGLGFTAGDVYQPESTYTRTLPWITFFWYGDANQTFVDVFDAEQMTKVRERVVAHAKSVADNPWILGLGGPDLQIWDSKLVRKYRELPPESAGRKRYHAFLRERYAGDIAKFNAVYRTGFASFDDLATQAKLTLPADAEDDQLDPWTLRWKLPVPPEKSANPPMQADNDAFCALVAETLFPVVRGACKEGAPNHLFLGEHLAVRMIPDAVIKVMGKYVDAYLAQAVEVSPQRPPEWQIFQRDRWDHEHALLQKPVVIVDWGAVFSHGDAFDYKGATIKPEREASDDAAKFITDAFDAPYIIGLFLCKLWGDHKNDANFFANRATRTYLKPDGTPYPYRTQKLREANFAVQQKAFDAAAKAN